MKRFAILTGLLGLLALTALVIHQGIGDIATIVAQGGWLLLVLVPLHALPLWLVSGTLEIWFALMLLGHPVPFWQALAIEALTQAARNVAFFVPAGLGVQEAVVMLLGQALGMDAQVSLALVKRAREILFGVPALLSWQWVELRRWRRGRAREAGSA
ncbi:hypothetical protein [Cupriavidus necator]